MKSKNVQSLLALHERFSIQAEDFLASILTDIPTCRKHARLWGHMRQNLRNYYGMKPDYSSDLSIDELVEMSR